MKISDIYDEGHRTITIAGKTFHWPFPLAWMLHGSSAIVLGYCVYGDNVPKIIDKLHDLFRSISDAKYWIYYRIHPSYQMHLIRTGLKPGYWCEDSRILHGCMACLEAHVEAEGGMEKMREWRCELLTTGDEHTKEVNERQAGHIAECLNILYWWKILKPADEKRNNELHHQLFGQRDVMTMEPIEGSTMVRTKFRDWTPAEQVKYDQMSALDIKIEEDEQKMLHRLINIRSSLWT